MSIEGELVAIFNNRPEVVIQKKQLSPGTRIKVSANQELSVVDENTVIETESSGWANEETPKYEVKLEDQQINDAKLEFVQTKESPFRQLWNALTWKKDVEFYRKGAAKIVQRYHWKPSNQPSQH